MLCAGAAPYSEGMNETSTGPRQWPHHMLEEIFEQPEALRRTIRTYATETEGKKGLGRLLKRRKDEIAEIKLSCNDIVRKIKEQGDMESQDASQASSTKVDPQSAKISMSEGSYTVLLEVVGGDVDCVWTSTM